MSPKTSGKAAGAERTPAAVAAASGGRRAQLVRAARHLLETGGPDAVTMRNLGAALGIRGPSIYKHVPDKAAIEAALIVEGLTELVETLEPITPTFTEIAHAYRTWALAHPHLYRLINSGPLLREALPVGLEERAATPLVQACGGDRDLARAAWATINGLIDLELADRFPPDADITAAYAAAARAIDGACLECR